MRKSIWGLGGFGFKRESLGFVRIWRKRAGGEQGHSGEGVGEGKLPA